MNLMIKSALLLIAIGPGIAAVSQGETWPQALTFLSGAAPTNASFLPKDESRIVPSVDDDYASLLIELVQAARQPAQTPPDIRTAQAFGLSPAFGESAVAHGAFAPFDLPPGRMLPMPVPMTRSSCEGRINAEAGMAGYLKSKLRLQPNQREAWQKLESVAEPAIEKLHTACEALPIEAGAPPSLPDLMDVMEAQLAARLEFIRVTREPLRALLATLSPEQRMALQPPLPPFPLP